jgi:alpha-L-rhamnosidase
VLALAFDLAPEERRAALFNHLVEGIMVAGNGHIGTGLIGGQWLMRVLSAEGRPDVACTIATKRDYPSWGYMLDQGATTIWELWNGDTADPGMNSHNHVMLIGDFIVWLYEALAGIGSDPCQPGFKKVVLKPSVPENLASVEASFNSMYGAIVSKWRRDQNTFSWEVVIPPNTTAEIHVPSKDPEAVTEGGAPFSSSKGLGFLRRENGVSVLAATAGRYVFQSTLP